MRALYLTCIVAYNFALFSGCYAGNDEYGVSGCGQLGVWILPEGTVVPPGDPDEALIEMQGNVTRARANLLAISIEAYCHIRGQYPASLEELLKVEPAEHMAPQCRPNADYMVDAWQQPFVYSVADGIPYVISVGVDGVIGTVDDITAARPSMSGARDIDIRMDC